MGWDSTLPIEVLDGAMRTCALYGDMMMGCGCVKSEKDERK
jgi:hypothetical protein